MHVFTINLINLNIYIFSVFCVPHFIFCRSVPWNVHEASPGKYDFSGQQDLPLFLKTAQDVGLSVLLGAGPYICGEWDYVSC